MADYFSIFSTEIPDLTPEEAEWIETDLALVDTWDLDDAGAAALRERTGLDGLDGPWPDFDWEIQVHPRGLSLWLSAADHFNADHVISFAGRFIDRFRPDYVFSMEWVDTCSRPCNDAFGGGWLVVTRDQVLSGTTSEAVQEILDRLGGACLAAHKYLVVETDAGSITTPRVFDTRAQLDEYLERWARAAGYESYAGYRASDRPERDADWFEFTVQVSELSPDVVVDIA